MHALRPCRALYISYDGLLEPLGQSQILPYLRKMSVDGVTYSVVSFEKPEDLGDRRRVSELAVELGQRGITWAPLRYHKRPATLATAYDIVRGAIAAVTLLWREKYQLIHARSYIAATMAWLIMRVTSIRLLFDMRGFWVDERVDGGIWSADSWIVRLARWWERRILREADAIVVLAATAIPHLDSLARRTLRAPVVVVPTSVDLDRFRPQDRPTVRRALGLPEEAFILVYSGSLGTWYLGRETFEVAEAVASQVDKFAMIVLTRETQLAEALLPSAIQARTRILTAFHSEMPAWVAAADAGLAFIRPRFSKVASCPTKIGEYLACGVPVATTDGIGDVSVLLDERVSVLFSDWSPSSLREGATRLVRLAVRPDTVERCRAVAAEHFSLERAVHDLRGLYQRCSLDE